MVKSVKMGDKKVKTDPEVSSYCFLSVFTFFLYFQETYIGNQRYTLRVGFMQKRPGGPAVHQGPFFNSATWLYI